MSDWGRLRRRPVPQRVALRYGAADLALDVRDRNRRRRIRVRVPSPNRIWPPTTTLRCKSRVRVRCCCKPRSASAGSRRADRRHRRPCAPRCADRLRIECRCHTGRVRGRAVIPIGGPGSDRQHAQPLPAAVQPGGGTAQTVPGCATRVRPRPQPGWGGVGCPPIRCGDRVSESGSRARVSTAPTCRCRGDRTQSSPPSRRSTRTRWCCWKPATRLSCRGGTPRTRFCRCGTLARRVGRRSRISLWAG